MRLGNSHKHENSKHSEAKLGINVMVLDKGEKESMGSLILKLRMADSWVDEEKEHTWQANPCFSGTQGTS